MNKKGFAFQIVPDVSRFLEQNWREKLNVNLSYDPITHKYTWNGKQLRSATGILKGLDGAAFEDVERDACRNSAKSFTDNLGRASEFKGVGMTIEMVKKLASSFVFKKLIKHGVISPYEVLKPTDPALFMLNLMNDSKKAECTYDQILCLMFESRIINEYVLEMDTSNKEQGQGFTYICVNNVHTLMTEFNDVYDPNNPGLDPNGFPATPKLDQPIISTDYGNGLVFIDCTKRISFAKVTAIGIRYSELENISKQINAGIKYNDFVTKARAYVSFSWKLAAVFGTILHADMELFMNHLAANMVQSPPIASIYSESSALKLEIYNFLKEKENEDMVPWGTEVKVYSTMYGIAGTVDCILKHKTEEIYDIIDWKRCKDVMGKHTYKKELDKNGWFFWLDNNKYKVAQRIRRGTTGEAYDFYRNGEKLDNVDESIIEAFGTRKIDFYFNQIALYKLMVLESLPAKAKIRKLHVFTIRPFGSDQRFKRYSCPGFEELSDSAYLTNRNQKDWYKNLDTLSKRAVAIAQNLNYIPLPKEDKIIIDNGEADF